MWISAEYACVAENAAPVGGVGPQVLGDVEGADNWQDPCPEVPGGDVQRITCRRARDATAVSVGSWSPSPRGVLDPKEEATGHS